MRAIFLYNVRIEFGDTGESESFTTITDHQLSEDEKETISNAACTQFQGINLVVEEHGEPLSAQPFVSIVEQLHTIVARHRPECFLGTSARAANARTQRSKPGKRRGLKAVQ